MLLLEHNKKNNGNLSKTNRRLSKGKIAWMKRDSAYNIALLWTGKIIERLFPRIWETFKFIELDNIINEFDKKITLLGSLPYEMEIESLIRNYILNKNYEFKEKQNNMARPLFSIEKTIIKKELENLSYEDMRKLDEFEALEACGLSGTRKFLNEEIADIKLAIGIKYVRNFVDFLHEQATKKLKMEQSYYTSVDVNIPSIYIYKDKYVIRLGDHDNGRSYDYDFRYQALDVKKPNLKNKELQNLINLINA